MNKQVFLAEIASKLHGLPQKDIEERLNFYNEMIDDRMEEGLSEEAAVSEIGSADEVVSQILADFPLSKLVKERAMPKRRLKSWEIALLALGSPIWLSLLVGAFAIVLAAYAVIWSVIISLWAIEVSLWGCSLAGIISAVLMATQGNVTAGVAMLGASLFCAGLSISLFFACKAASKGAFLLTKRIALGIKSLFVGKGDTK